MSIFAFIGLWIIIRLDSLIFQKIDKDLFRQQFTFPLLFKIVIAFLALSIVIFREDPWDLFAVFLMILALPLYILRRNAFVKQAAEFFEHNPTVKIKSGALGVIIHWFFIVLCFEICVHLLSGINLFAISEFGSALLSTVFSSLVFLVLIERAARDFQSPTFNENIKLVRGRKSILSTFVIPALIGLFFAWFSAWIVTSRPVQPDTPLGDILETNNSSAAILIFLFLAVILAPLVEEIVFRGYFYRVLERARGKGLAVLIIALSFGILHIEQYWGDWTAICMVGLLGFVLTLVRLWTDSVISSAMVHYFYNGGVVVLTAIIIMVSNPPYFDYCVRSQVYDFLAKERLLKDSIFIQPQMAEAYYELSRLYLEESKHLEEGLDMINKALSFNKESLRFLKVKLALLQVLKRSDEVRLLQDMMKGLYPDRDWEDFVHLK